MKIQDYTVVSEEGSDKIENKIKSMLAEGWIPVGSVCCTIIPDKHTLSTKLYSQAMVLYTTDKQKK